MCSNACSHTFAWHSVMPPTHCPVCGACLSCGARTAPVMPSPWPAPYYPPPRPWPYYQGPIYGTSVGITTSTNTAVAA